jgi:hypothetical protein
MDKSTQQLLLAACGVLAGALLLMMTAWSGHTPLNFLGTMVWVLVH